MKNRREIEDFGLTVHIIEPGLHKTSVSDADLVKRSITRDFEALPDSIRKEYGKAYCDKCKQLLAFLMIFFVKTKDKESWNTGKYPVPCVLS